MYRIFQPDPNQLVVHIEGRLDSIKFKRELIEEVGRIQKDSIQGNHEDILVIDLSRILWISDECLDALKEVRMVYKVKYQSQSLFINSQLADHNLLE